MGGFFFFLGLGWEKCFDCSPTPTLSLNPKKKTQEALERERERERESKMKVTENKGWNLAKMWNSFFGVETLTKAWLKLYKAYNVHKAL